MSNHERVRFALSTLGALVVLVMVGLAPAGASAQTYSASLEPMPYEALPLSPGDPVQSVAVQGWGWTPPQLTVTLDFPVEFYGETYTSMNIVGMGMVTFGNIYTTTPASNPTTAGQREIPSTASGPHNFIAVWWDKVTCESAGSFKKQIVGTAPNRFMVFQWTNCRRYSSSPVSAMNAQLWLSEASSDIEVRYGPITETTNAMIWTTSMGVENADGSDGTPGPTINGTVCNPNCLVGDFPTGHRIIYSAGPAASIDAVSVNPLPINIGQQVSANALVTNGRSKPLENVTVRYWIGSSQSVSDAQELGLVTGVTIPANGSMDFPLTVDSTGWAPGQYYVIAELDPFGMHFPLDEPRQTYSVGPYQVKEPTSALRVIGGTVEAPGWVEAEATFDVTWDVDNLDLLEATSAMFYVVLSADTVIGEEDAVIGVGHFSLAANARTSMTKTVKLPPGLAEGRYWIGVWLDPYSEIPHVNRAGNRRIANAQTTVGLELEISTKDLPGGRVGDAYAAGLYATGGDGIYSWTVSAGSLPPGLAIDRVAGVDRIAGFPQTAGVYAFQLEASSDRFVDRASWTIEILPALVPLEISTTALPDATLGHGYSAVLVARGGTPPYTWSFDGLAPEGLTLSPSGRFGGTPAQEGRQVMFVAVQDGAGARVSRPLNLNVEVAALACADVTNLAPVMAGSDLHPVTLYANGGKAPYEWASVKGAVPGLTLTAQGTITGSPADPGKFDWTVEVSDVFANKAQCKVKLEVTEEPKSVELKIATDSLPRARVLDAFEIRLEATGVTGTLSWTLAGGGSLPDGLVLTQDGTLRGVPSPSALEGEESRTFEIRVQATDSASRVASATLSLEVYDDREPVTPVKPTIKTVKKDGGGCQSTSGDASLLALGLALGLTALRTRKSGAR